MRIIWIASTLLIFLSIGITELIFEIQTGRLFVKEKRSFPRGVGEKSGAVNVEFESWGCGTWFLILISIAAFFGFIFWIGLNNDYINYIWNDLILQVFKN